MLIVFCVERPSEEGGPFGWGIELCGSSSCLEGLRSKKINVHHSPKIMYSDFNQQIT